VSQIFHRSTNTLSRFSIFGAIFVAAALVWALALVNRSSWVTDAGVARDQPVQFSHAHHAGGMGIDCRYCHTSVEDSSFANVPATKICMNCHAQVWAQSPYLEPVRASFRTGVPIRWTRVNDLPDFVYFNHGIHVQKGVGCVTCHGPVDRMPLMYQYATLQMEWCLDCHRDPAPFLRPREAVFRMDYQPPADQAALGARLMREYRVRDARTLTSCSICHR
jgi:hypothetical protein